MIFDIIVIAALLVSAVIAFLRGFIREVLTILGVVGGLAASYFGGPMASPIVRGWFATGDEGEKSEKLFDLVPYDIVADAIAYGSIFIIVVIVLSVASHFLSGWAKTIGLGAVDRILGIIFGLARGIVILALLYLPVHILTDAEKRSEWQWIQESKSHYYVELTSNWMASFLPEKTRDDAGKVLEQTAESMAKATRDQLQEMDVLPQETQKTRPEMLKSSEAADAPSREAETETKPAIPETAQPLSADVDVDADADANGEEIDGGYNEDERINLDELFEEQITQPSNDDADTPAQEPPDE